MSFFQRIKVGDEKYPSLTGIRALGATVVFIVHFPINPDAHIGANVMAFFYVLSGFLIVRIYYSQSELKPLWLSKYFINRFARIYPVYFLLLTIAVILGHHSKLWLLFKNYTLIHALFHNYGGFIIGPSWSLTVEECFYFLAPVFMLLIKRWNFLVSFAAATCLLFIVLVISIQGFDFLGTPLFIFSTTFFGHFVEFFAGIFLAMVVMKVERNGSISTKGCRWTVIGSAGIITLLTIITIINSHPPLNFTAIFLVNNFLIPVPIAIFYFGLIREKTFISKLLGGKLSGILGRSSYSFYLLHTILINYLSIPILLPLFPNRPLCVLFTFIITWIISIMLFVFYEEPLNLFIRNKFKSKNKSAGHTKTLFPIKSFSGGKY